MMKVALLLFVAVSSANLCLAEDNTKWSIGLGAGSAKYKKAALSKSDSLIAFSGGYVINDISAVEVAYTNLGSVKDRILPNNVISLTQDTLSLEAKGFTVASIFSWQVTAPLALSAKLGVSVLDVDRQWSGGTLVDPSRANDTGGMDAGIYGGLRLQYKINKSWSFDLNWDRYEAEQIDIDGFYAKANIHF